MAWPTVNLRLLAANCFRGRRYFSLKSIHFSHENDNESFCAGLAQAGFMTGAPVLSSRGLF
jgi:hypothetical protein